MKFSIPINKSSQIVQLDYFFKINDENFYSFIRDMSELIDEMSSFINQKFHIYSPLS